jgi:dihydroxyacetone kinase-like protein
MHAVNPNKISHRINIGPQVRVTGESLRLWMRLFATRMQQDEEELTALDAAIGDGDHGVNMRRGTTAVIEKLDELGLSDLAGQMRVVSTTLLSSVGGASGPLYSAFFLQASHCIHHKSELGVTDLTSAIEAGYRGVTQLGKAVVGDKTMVDTLAAAVSSLRTSCIHHESLPQALKNCRKTCRRAAESTIQMVARKGRASYLGERSAGVQDPGATSAAALIDCLADAVAMISPQTQTPTVSLL